MQLSLCSKGHVRPLKVEGGGEQEAPQAGGGDELGAGQVEAEKLEVAEDDARSRPSRPTSTPPQEKPQPRADSSSWRSPRVRNAKSTSSLASPTDAVRDVQLLVCCARSSAGWEQCRKHGHRSIGW